MTVIHWALTTIEQVPATFWGVLAGSFFTLFGVWLTNKASERRMRMQFEHERSIKSSDRELALKKEIYLDLMAYLQALIAEISLSVFVDRDTKESGIELRKLLPILGRARLVAEVSTLIKIEEVDDELRRGFREVRGHVADIKLMKSKIATLREALNSGSKAEEKDESKRLEILELSERVRATRKQLKIRAKEIVVTANQKSPALLLAIRNELKIPTDMTEWATRSVARDQMRIRDLEEIQKEKV